MARSGYQSQNKDWGEMYEHELEACAAELDAMIDGLIAEDNSNANKLAELKARYLHVSELNHNQVSMVRADAAERDRLAAENAELRRINMESNDLIVRLGNENAELRNVLAKYAHAVGEGHPIPCDLGPLCPYCYIDRLAAENAELRKQLAGAKASHEALAEVATEIADAFNAANATLGALREAFERFSYLRNLPEDFSEADGKDKVRGLEELYSILYPQPAALAKEKTNG